MKFLPCFEKIRLFSAMEYTPSILFLGTGGILWEKGKITLVSKALREYNI